jgi:hypothetical protein
MPGNRLLENSRFLKEKLNTPQKGIFNLLDE